MCLDYLDGFSHFLFGFGAAGKKIPDSRGVVRLGLRVNPVS